MDLTELVFLWKVANVFGLIALTWYGSAPFRNKVGWKDLTVVGKAFLIVFFLPSLVIAGCLVAVWKVVSAVMIKSNKGETE